MSEKQIKDYLEKYNITSKELLAKHIEELKRNTKPNTKLISELVWVLEDFFFSFFERSSCPAEKESKEQRLKTEENLVFAKDSEIHKEGIKTSNITTNGEIISQDEYSVTIDFSKTGIKESNGKTDYSEIDWDFIEAQALRMNKNKGKYEAGNYKKPMNINLLKQSLLRHVLEVLKDNYQDDGDELGHLSAIALNAQFLHYQLKNNVK